MSALPLILAVITALAFTAAAAANALDLGGTAKSFDDWGYPPVGRFITAVLEVAGAFMLIPPQTRPAGELLLGLVIAGALLTLLRAHAGWRHLAPAIGFGLLLLAESLSTGWSV